MKLSSALELQNDIFEKDFGFVREAIHEHLSHPHFSRPSDLIKKAVKRITEKKSDVGIAIGIGYAAASRSREHRITAFVQSRRHLKSALLEKIRSRAANEVDVVYTGPIRARQWYDQAANPLRIGCSIAHLASRTGTIGCFVKDNQTRETCILSNNHVLANVNLAAVGEPVLQPGPMDGGSVGGNTVAKLIRLVDIKLGGQVANEVDCAIASLAANGPQFDARAVCDNTGASFGNPLASQFAEAYPEMPVEKIGRTTGHTTGYVRDINVCNLIVEMSPGNYAKFDGQIAFHSTMQNETFSANGDSGALIMTDLHEPVALLFAGSDEGGGNGRGITYGNPIDRVLSSLKVSIM
jgi:hypothetical protein